MAAGMLQQLLVLSLAQVAPQPATASAEAKGSASAEAPASAVAAPTRAAEGKGAASAEAPASAVAAPARAAEPAATPVSVESRYGVGLPRAGDPPAAGGWRLNPPERWYGLRLAAELGFVGVVKHGIQFGREGTWFDFRNEGGQDVLFPFFRFTGEFVIKQRHFLSFLIQPLKLKSSATLQRELRVDEVVFPAGTPMALKYDFGFYRFGYLYDFLKHPDQEFGLGLALQIRNATIDFASRDGELLADTRNIGVVPLVKLRGRWTPRRGGGFWLGAEVDGAYIRGRVISGTRDYFTGALLDASLRAGFAVPRAGDVFVNVRYVGGGARGADSSPDPGTDGFTDNWLHTMALSLGLYIR
jgi:hypothetical protein